MTKEGFISYYPLKQGLKHFDVKNVPAEQVRFISYYPLKQGLKPSVYDSVVQVAQNLYPTIH